MNALELFALKTGKYGRVAQTIKNMRITKNLNRGFPRESLCSLISLRLLQVAHHYLFFLFLDNVDITGICYYSATYNSTSTYSKHCRINEDLCA